MRSHYNATCDGQFKLNEVPLAHVRPSSKMGATGSKARGASERKMNIFLEIRGKEQINTLGKSLL
jgi:hypothetical protein